MTPGSEVAAHELTDALMMAEQELASKGLTARAEVVLGNLFAKHLEPVMTKWAAWGACDSEPRYHARAYLRQRCQALYGTGEDADF